MPKTNPKAIEAEAYYLADVKRSLKDVANKFDTSLSTVHGWSSKRKWAKKREDLAKTQLGKVEDLREQKEVEARAFESNRLQKLRSLDDALDCLAKEYFEYDESGRITGLIPRFKANRDGTQEQILPHVLVQGYFDALAKVTNHNRTITGANVREKLELKEAGAPRVFAPISMNNSSAPPVMKQAKAQVVPESVPKSEIPPDETESETE